MTGMLLLLPVILLLCLGFFAVPVIGPIVPFAGGGIASLPANSFGQASLVQPAIVEGLFVNPVDHIVPPPLPQGMEFHVPIPPPKHGNGHRKLLKNGSRLTKGAKDNAKINAAEDDGTNGHGRKLATKIYTLNFKNNCKRSLYVKSYTRVQGQRMPQALDLKPGASASVQVPSTYRDVELYPLENCKGPKGTQCSSGGCKNNPGAEQCAQGDGHQSQIRFDFRDGQDTYNNNADTDGFNVPARLVPSNPACNPMDLTSSSKLNVICDNSQQQNVHFDVTYCPN